MLLIIKKTILKFTLYQASRHLSLPALNISKCQSVLTYMSLLYHKLFYLHDSYISKYDFMNYLFANLVVVSALGDKENVGTAFVVAIIVSISVCVVLVLRRSHLTLE